MNILIVTQYFRPESFIINDVADRLRLLGHDVTVATGKPNYPTGKIFDGYRSYGISKETLDNGIAIYRIPIIPRGASRPLNLVLNYASFLLSGLFLLPIALTRQKFDAVLFFGVSPLTSAIPAALISGLKKAPLAIWVQDLWPETIKAASKVQNRLVLRLVELVMKYIYRFSDTVIVQSRAFIDPISSLCNIEKVRYLPNPAPDEPISYPLSASISELFNDCFSIVFAGNLGKAQSLETILKAAERLRAYEHIKFIVIGDGSEASRLSKSVTESGLSNVVMTGQLDRKMMSSAYSLSSALLVTLKNDPAYSLVIPSKVQAYMQAGKPIIAAVNGEGARLISETGCGHAVAAEDDRALAETILTFAAMPANRLSEMGRAGRQHYQTHFQVETVTEQLIEILESRAGINSEQN